MIAHVARAAPQASIGMVSNALACSISHWETLIQAGLTSISFSIDTLDPTRFAKQRGGGSIVKAMRIVEGVAGLRAGLDDPLSVRLKAVLLDDPYGDARALQDWSHRIGLDRPQFSVLDTRAQAQTLYAGDDNLTVGLADDASAEAFEQAMEQRWKNLNGAMPAPLPLRRYRHPALSPDRSLCHWAKDAAFIAADGLLLSCCESMIDLPRRNRGSLRRTRMSIAWQEDLFWSYRLPLSLRHLPPECVGCSYAPQ
jgi:hypothetical protein